MFQMFIETTSSPKDDLFAQDGEHISYVQDRIFKARKSILGTYNNHENRDIRQPGDEPIFSEMSSDCKKLVETGIYRLNLDYAETNHVLRVSKTIASMDDSGTIKAEHIAEAIQYQSYEFPTSRS